MNEFNKKFLFSIEKTNNNFKLYASKASLQFTQNIAIKNHKIPTKMLTIIHHLTPFKNFPSFQRPLVPEVTSS